MSFANKDLDQSVFTSFTDYDLLYHEEQPFVLMKNEERLP